MSNDKFINEFVNFWSNIHNNKKIIILYYLLRMDKYDNPQLLTDYYKSNMLKILGGYELHHKQKDYELLIGFLNDYIYASEWLLDDIKKEIMMMDETITRYEKKEDRLLYER